MKKTVFLVLVISFALSLSAVGCGQKSTGSSTEAIQSVQTMQTTQEKVTSLISQANALYNSKQFQQAIDIAKYILTTLDSNSQPAKDLLTKATEALKAQAGKVVEDVKGTLGSFGK